MDKYIGGIDTEKTVVITDATLIQKPPDRLKKIYPVNATHVAEQDFGQALFANIVMLGALSAITGMVAVESLEKALQGNVPEKTLEKNRSALRKGAEIGNKLKAEAAS